VIPNEKIDRQSHLNFL